MENEKNLASGPVRRRPGRQRLRRLGPGWRVIPWVALACWSGCQGAPPHNAQVAAIGAVRPVEESVSPAKAESAADKLASIMPGSQMLASPEPSTPSDTRTADQPVSEQEAMATVLEKLQEMGAIDPAAQQLLMAKLRAAEPKYWSVMVEQFQSTLEFRQQLAARGSRQSGNLANQYCNEQTTSDGRNVVSTDQEPGAPAKSTRPDSQVVLLDPPTADSPQSLSLQAEPAERKSDRATVADNGNRVAPAEPSVRAVSYQPGKNHQRGGPIADHARSQNPALKTDIWEQVIAQMEETVNEVPDSMDDIHQQMRLRMLNLIAGRQEEAFRPISGATPAQQDYWSQQLFALATFLDNQTQPDSRRRATAALLHLDEARGTLAQLATLDVRNLAFVESVDGYGAYKSASELQFEPGQQVTLYAEVENFHSETIKEGFRISLGTSYQVVDEGGRRVDGGQFPDVLDQCKNRRRDLHIQYGIPLPMRIYPGNYQLQLIVTDNQTSMIGQASLSFEIAEEHGGSN